MPIINMGFWPELVEKWGKEGHLTREEVKGYMDYGQNMDGNIPELAISRKLGFDDTILNYTGQRGAFYDVPLFPTFTPSIVEEFDDGSYMALDSDGVYLKGRKGAISIQAEVDHTAKDRVSWEKHYMPKLQWSDARLDMDALKELVLTNDTRDRYMCVYCGSLFGKMRNYWGIEGVSYLQVDDPQLYEECINAIADVTYMIVKKTLETGVKLDFGHFWEDVCFRTGPLIQPEVFRDKVGKHYRRIADECNKYGIDILSVDCDGFIEDLIPVWLDNGVNIMLPIEYGAWEYDFSSMRKKFGKELRGIGNINKHALARDKKAVDKEVERARRLVDLGGFVPCLDHRIAIDAEWDLVRYYCDKMKEALWK
jgi:uroporphyrinogen decarboxylase